MGKREIGNRLQAHGEAGGGEGGVEVQLKFSLPDLEIREIHGLLSRQTLKSNVSLFHLDAVI